LLLQTRKFVLGEACFKPVANFIEFFELDESRLILVNLCEVSIDVLPFVSEFASNELFLVVEVSQFHCIDGPELVFTTSLR
jgi:hypothetical protein